MAALAAPSVSPDSVSVAHGPNGDVVKIYYTLVGEPAVVTVDLQTNTLADASGAWVSIGGEATGALGGDANTIVTRMDSASCAYWFPSQTFRNRQIAGGTLRAMVKAWPTNAPPDYMVVNLTAPTNTVRFYETTAQFPGGFTNLDYKTSKLVMRKIPAAGVVWRMGSPDGETGKNSNNDIVHYVKLTEDYYAGIYEVTQSQYFNICGAYHNCTARNYDDSAIRAFNNVQYTKIRGQNKDTKTGYWPENGHTVTVSSVIGILRSRCGIADMDLPTSAQWEYACRAGTGSALPNGMAFSSANLADIAFRASGGPIAVGSKVPNNWGLYDMIGNVMEATLDAGQHALPFKFNVPVAGTLVTPGGDVKGVILRPGETAVDIPEPGLVTFQVFGDRAKPTALR
jgi:formylglycine-generating enzyme required for sulfatase activity